MDSLIRWKRSDYMKLSKAVSRFNKIINELEVDEKEYLPELKDYKEIRDKITSRKELNRIINSLKRATEENLLTKRIFESGEVISKWEFQEVNKARSRAFRSLEKERQDILSSRQSIGMGDERLSEIRAIENSFLTLEYRKGSDLKKLKERIFRVGATDRKLRKAQIFRENFYTALEGLSSYDNYGILKNKLDKIKNPIKFYEYVSQSPILMDIFIYYRSKESNIYGAFNTNEEAFNSALLYHLGIDNVEV